MVNKFRKVPRHDRFDIVRSKMNEKWTDPHVTSFWFSGYRTWRRLWLLAFFDVDYIYIHILMMTLFCMRLSVSKQSINIRHGTKFLWSWFCSEDHLWSLGTQNNHPSNSSVRSEVIWSCLGHDPVLRLFVDLRHFCSMDWWEKLTRKSPRFTRKIYGFRTVSIFLASTNPLNVWPCLTRLSGYKMLQAWTPKTRTPVVKAE